MPSRHCPGLSVAARRLVSSRGPHSRNPPLHLPDLRPSFLPLPSQLALGRVQAVPILGIILVTGLRVELDGGSRVTETCGEEQPREAFARPAKAVGKALGRT